MDSTTAPLANRPGKQKKGKKKKKKSRSPDNVQVAGKLAAPDSTIIQKH